MSINKLVSIHDSIYNALGDTGMDIHSEIPTLMRWAVDAEKKIGSYYGWKKMIKVLTACECRVKLPLECMRVQCVVFGDYGCSCNSMMDSCSNWAINNLGSFISSSGGDMFLNIDADPTSGAFGLCGNPYEIQNNHLVYGQNIDGQKITVRYLGYEVDDDGFLLVSENHIMAIVAYIKWMIAKRSRYSPNKMELGDIKLNEVEWTQLLGQARGEDNDLNETDKRAIMAMLHDPYAGFGLVVGMTGSNPYSLGMLY